MSRPDVIKESLIFTELLALLPDSTISAYYKSFIMFLGSKMKLVDCMTYLHELERK